MNTYRVLEIEHLTVHTFRLRTERPNCLIKAGQCFSIGPPGLGINREYSIYSAANLHYMEFLIRSVDNGVVSCPLQQTKPGDSIEIDGPYGEFYLDEPVDMTSASVMRCSSPRVYVLDRGEATEVWGNLCSGYVHAADTARESGTREVAIAGLRR